MEKLANKNICTGCGACFNVCPSKAIKMSVDKNGFRYPEIDSNKCKNCNLCVKVCPILSGKIKNKFEKTKVYACKNKDKYIRMASSSGGIFSLFANLIIKNNGLVFGAKFNDDFEVVHDFVEKKSDLKKMYGSKYVESNTGENYKKVKEFLEKDKYVLFSGTPCQIAGLKMFLRKEYSKLYTLDIICHGVPSSKVWKKYISEFTEIKKINFRDKANGWHNSNIKIVSKSNSISESSSTNVYMQLFLQNYCLRESCYNCHFKGENRFSDITIGDFWGIEKIDASFDDDKGISVLLLNNSHGEKLFKKIENNIEYKIIDYKNAFNSNTAYYESVVVPKVRNAFFKDLNKNTMKKLYKKYVINYGDHYTKIVYIKFRKILGKMKRKILKR